MVFGVFHTLLVAVVIAGVAIYRSTLPSQEPNYSNPEKETYCMRGNCTWISADAKDFNTSQGPLLVNEKQGWFYGTRNELYWTPQNALWKDGLNGVTDGQHYWQIHVIKFKGPGLHVGVTTPTMFQPGWSITGLFFGQGRRSNGYNYLEGIESEFGPNIKPGDVVGIYLEFSGSRAKVYFDINDISLGLAFDIPLDKLMGEGQDAMPEFYPVVQFFNEGVVRIRKLWGKPASLRRTWLNPDQDGESAWFYSSGFIDPSTSPTTSAMLSLVLKNKNVTLGKQDNYIIQKFDYTLSGSGITPDFEREMIQFLMNDELTWSIILHKDILIIEDISKEKVTTWTKGTTEPVELTPVKNLGKSW